MSAPVVSQKLHDKNQLDLAIDRFAQLDIFTLTDLNQIGVIAQVQQGVDTKKLARFRRKGLRMDQKKLRNENHYSSRMRLQLTRAGYACPSGRYDALAIISGNHPDAARMSAVLAWCKMRIDDHHNGCWLPRDRDDKPYMPKFLRKAVPHRNIHTDNYYEWIRETINYLNIDGLEKLVEELRIIRFRLQSGTVRKNIWS